MKKLLLLYFLLLTSNCIFPQQQKSEDSLAAIINKQAGDTSEVNALVLLAFRNFNFDSSIYYVQKGLVLARKLKYKKEKQIVF